MLADRLDYVGVDPHRDLHALAVVDVLSGTVVFEATVAANGDGMNAALKLVNAHASGRRAFAVEQTGSFGARLTRFLSGRGERVLEVGGCAGSVARAARRRARRYSCRPQCARAGATRDTPCGRRTSGIAGACGRPRGRSQRPSAPDSHSCATC